MTAPSISLLAFALIEYERRQWQMPNVHVRIYHWMEATDGVPVRVLRVFRGCGKSTIIGIRNSHKYREKPTHQILVQGADNELAEDISQDTLAIMAGNELTQGIIRNGSRAKVRRWWTNDGYKVDARTPQMRAKGILSRTTGNRADEIQNDDVEVEKNVTDEKQRKKLRKKLGEQTHILKPDGTIIYIGTPHAHDSLYDELIEGGAEHLTIPMFAHQERYEKDMHRMTRLPIRSEIYPDGLWVFAGIGAPARLLKEGADYTIESGVVVLARPLNCTIDICTGNAWPERFHRAEMEKRRKKCRTFNEWDSQYQLEAKPMHECRLNPDLLNEYEVEPVFRDVNGVVACSIGNARIVGMKCRWDVASGQIDRDASVLTVLFQDESGNEYLHRAIRLLGEIDEQCDQIKKAVREFRIPSIEVETNGIGKHVPVILRKALAGTGCAVTGKDSRQNKHARILAALEPVLSAGLLWVHTSVYEGDESGGLVAEMKDFVPGVDGKDDFMDSAAGAILSAPVRIRPNRTAVSSGQPGSFRPSGKQFTAAADFGV